MKAADDPELRQLSHSILGAAIEVHRILGPGYLESVYEEALAVELKLRGIPFVRQVETSVAYKGTRVGAGRIDLLVAGKVVVELKTVDEFAPVHKAQVLSYLKSSGCHLGLLVNFKVAKLTDGIKRLVRD